MQRSSTHSRARREEAHRAEYEQFAESLIAHTVHEEEILYPAAVLVGAYLELRITTERPSSSSAERVLRGPRSRERAFSRIAGGAIAPHRLLGVPRSKLKTKGHT